jgi:hypothetical protein
MFFNLFNRLLSQRFYVRGCCADAIATQFNGDGTSSLLPIPVVRGSGALNLLNLLFPTLRPTNLAALPAGFLLTQFLEFTQLQEFFLALAYEIRRFFVS